MQYMCIAHLYIELDIAVALAFASAHDTEAFLSLWRKLQTEADCSVVPEPT